VFTRPSQPTANLGVGGKVLTSGSGGILDLLGESPYGFGLPPVSYPAFKIEDSSLLEFVTPGCFLTVAFLFFPLLLTSFVLDLLNTLLFCDLYETDDERV
jgi:hypothetical protein